MTSKTVTANEVLGKEPKATSQQYAYLSGEFVKLEDAKVSVMTHAFNYGTGVFEGIRGYYSEEKQQLYIFRLPEHYERMSRNCKVLKMKLPFSVDEMCRLTVKLARMNNHREDVYIRPIAFKSAKRIGVKIDDQDDFTVFMRPYGQYIETGRGLATCISSWRKLGDSSIPPRGKICGAYVNSALAGAEARDNGFDEAIVLNERGHVSEGSAMNLFVIRHGRLITPPVTDNILEGITRDCVMALAKNELGIETEVRSIDRTELYIADEMFFCGTGAQIAPVGSVDHRQIGDGNIGPITRQLQIVYNDVTHGHLEKYIHWLTPVY